MRPFPCKFTIRVPTKWTLIKLTNVYNASKPRLQFACWEANWGSTRSFLYTSRNLPHSILSQMTRLAQPQSSINGQDAPVDVFTFTYSSKI